MSRGYMRQPLHFYRQPWSRGVAGGGVVGVGGVEIGKAREKQRKKTLHGLKYIYIYI